VVVLTEKSPTQNSVWFPVLGIILIPIIIIIITIILFFLALKGTFNSDPKFNLAEIQDVIGAQLPADASDIVYDGERGNAAYVTLSFKASPQGALEFASHVCDGVLHQGYDPYDALNTSAPQPYQLYLIKYANFDFTYYSYSPDAAQTIWGNRCWPPADGLHQISVDGSNPERYTVQFDQLNQHSPLWGEDRQCNLIPRRIVGANYIQPLEALPLMAMGMAKVDNEFVLVTDEICLEFRIGYELGWHWKKVERWKHLIGADVDVLVDGELQGQAYISEDERLTLKGQEPGAFHHGYCFIKDWQPGDHYITLGIANSDGKNQHYRWDFKVD
jgi:hypothetical protein